MAVKQAKIIENDEMARVFKVVEKRERGNHIRDKVTLLLSAKAGLRVVEIAGLRWRDVTKADGSISDMIYVGSHIGKGGKSRKVPMNKDLKVMLELLRKIRPSDDFIRYGDYKDTITANTLAVWFKRVYSEAGLEGCSSHSGRRSYITKMARTANLHGASLRDVQLLAGHANIATTERYIEPSEGVINMVNAL